MKLDGDKEFTNISLAGLMGSGKTTIGKYLARQLKKTFVDTDLVIEEREGRSINDIFSENGEAYFRKLEADVINEFLKKEDQVISLGGGAIVSDDNRNTLKDNSILITLVAEPKDLAQRVARRKTRPLLNESKDQLKKLEELWGERKDAYHDSHICIDTTGKSINSLSQELMKSLGLKRPKVQELEVNIGRPDFNYKILYKDLSRLNIDSLKPGKQVLVVSQEPIAKHYLDMVVEKLSGAYTVNTMIIDNGEDAKNFFTYQLILQKLLSLNFERKDTLVALGGGVVGDIVGFAASTFYRGINYVQIPTTLLSMIDSSVGGKTAINVPEGKNLIGSFYQPHMVHIDVANLKTLPNKEFKSGLGELVKYTLLGEKWDSDLGDVFYDFVMNNIDNILDREEETLSQIINHCLRIKAGIVSADETEKGLRAHLNLGHTFGHAIEEVTKYSRYSHGEAVAIGLVCACYMSEDLAYFKPTHTKKVIDMLKALNLEYSIPADIKTSDLLKAFKYDKKSENGKPAFILPKSSIGRVETIPDLDLRFAMRAMERNRA